MFEQFDQSARRVLVVATVRARQRREAAGTEDLLAAMGTDETTPAGRCLYALGVRAEEAAARPPVDEGEPRDHRPFSGHARELLRVAAKLAEDREEPVSELHLLTALISNPDSSACRRLQAMGVDVYWMKDLRDGGGLLDVAAVERPWHQERLPW